MYSAIPFFRVFADPCFKPIYHNHFFRVLASFSLTYVQYDRAIWPKLHIPATYIGGHLQGVTAHRAVHTYITITRLILLTTAVAHLLQLVGRYLPLSYLAPSLDVAVAVARHTSCSFPIKLTS